MDRAVSLDHADRLELTVEPRPWPFALARRAEIEAHSAAMQRGKPALWNGRVPLMHIAGARRDGTAYIQAGQIYLPCGTPGPEEVVSSKPDFEFSIRRELTEETGLDTTNLTPEPGWTIAYDGALIVAIRVLLGSRCRGSAHTHSRLDKPPAPARALRHPHRAQPARFRSAHAPIRARLPSETFCRGLKPASGA